MICCQIEQTIISALLSACLNFIRTNDPCEAYRGLIDTFVLDIHRNFHNIVFHISRGFKSRMIYTLCKQNTLLFSSKLVIYHNRFSIRKCNLFRTAGKLCIIIILNEQFLHGSNDPHFNIKETLIKSAFCIKKALFYINFASTFNVLCENIII